MTLRTNQEIDNLFSEVAELRKSYIRLLQWIVSLDAGRTKLCEQELEKLEKPVSANGER